MFKKLTVIIWGVSDKWANKEAKKSIYRLLKESTQRWCAADEGDSMDSEKTFNVGARCCGTGQSVGLPGLLVQWETSNTERGLLFTQWLSCFQDLVLCSFFQKPSQIHLIRATVPVSLEEHLSPLPVLSHPSVCCSNGPFLALPFSYLLHVSILNPRTATVSYSLLKNFHFLMFGSVVNSVCVVWYFEPSEVTQANTESHYNVSFR